MAAFVAKQMMGSKLNAVKGQMNVGQTESEPEEEADPERLEAVREAEERRKEKHQRMEEEREKLRQGIRDKYGIQKKEDEEEEENPLTDDNRPAEIEVDDFTRWKNTLEAHLGGIKQTIESKCVLQ